MTMTPQSAAEFVMANLRKAGYEAWLVGGCVRDLVLGREPKDFDVTTNATPKQVTGVFENDRLFDLWKCHTIPVGAKFGVVVVMVEGVQTEVATYRADGAYTDGRRPDEVRYSTSVRDDVTRRDFTMNGLVADFTDEGANCNRPGFEGSGSEPLFLKDFVGGLADLKAKLVRCIGDPNKRFEEDALRMLRAVRFVAQLGFEIEEGTFKAIQANVDSIKNVSRERVVEELFKLTTGKFAVRGLTALVTTGLFRRVFPAKFVEDANVALILERFSLNQTTDPVLGLAMLMADSTALGAKEALDSFKLSKEVYNAVYGARANQNNFYYAYGYDDADTILLAREAGVLSPGVALFEQSLGLGLFGGVEAGMSTVLRFRNLTNEQINPTPLVTGADLIAMGHKPGPMFTTVLRDTERHQLNGKFQSREQALEYAKLSAMAYYPLDLEK
jgi:tRNA nucleotidyltransferase/poly(A) polymerase